MKTKMHSSKICRKIKRSISWLNSVLRKAKLLIFKPWLPEVSLLARINLK